MSEKDDGGRAFPFAYETSHPEEHGINGGMTLRDYFAAKWLVNITIYPGAAVTPEKVAADCYRIADALLKERAK